MTNITHHENPRRRSSIALSALSALSVIGLLAAGCSRSTAAEPTPPPAPNDTSATPVLVGSSTSSTSSTPIVRPSRPVDDLVAVHGARLHVRCEGSGDVTVVLISGFGDGDAKWASVRPEVSRQARVCSYERFGDGTSDPPPNTQTFATEATDLRAALRSIDEPGPFLVVGHSFGGAEAVTFTARFPTEVMGLVLVDASPIGWITASCAVPDNGSAGSQGFKMSCHMASSPANNTERLDGPAAFAEVAAIDSLGRVPMIVTTAARHPFPGLAAGEEARLNQVWDAGQQHWMSLSPSAELVSVDNSSHNIQLDRPDVVIQQIQRLLP